MKLTLAEIASAIGALSPENTDFVCTQVQTDSRLVRPGDLFFCLVGENHDGHDYAVQAKDNGAAAVVCHKKLPELAGIPVLRAGDTTRALADLACFWRKKTKARVIGITGSAGKTTCKEILTSVLAEYGRVGASFKNWNNQIGLPLSLLRFDGDEDFWVVELGISHPHDMDELGQILLPDIAMILNVGACHTSGLGSPADVAVAKSSLLRWIRPGGTALVCADYPQLVSAALWHKKKTVFFSQQEKSEAEFHARVCQVEHDCAAYQLTGGKNMTVRMPGQPLAGTLAAVYGLVSLLGLDVEASFAKRLEHFQPVEQRFVVHACAGWQIVDDTYNANPLSMRQSLESVAWLAGQNNLLLVLGRMAELGNQAPEEHEQLGRLVVRTGARWLFFYGEQEFAWVQAGLESWPGKAVLVTTEEEFFSCLKEIPIKNGGVALFKGSRSGHMEKYMRIFQSFLKENS